MIPIVLSQSLWMFFVWLVPPVFTSNLNSQTTWLKVNLKLVNCAAVQLRCMFFSTVKICLYTLSEESTRSFSSLSANPFLWRSLIFHTPCLVRLSLIFFLIGIIDSAISFRTLWTIFWLGKTSNKTISLMTGLWISNLQVMYVDALPES